MPYPDVEENLPEAILAAELLSTTGKQHHAMHNTIHRLLNVFQKVVGTGWGDPSQPGFRSVRQRMEAVEASIPVGAVMAYSGPYVAPDTAGATVFPSAPAGWAFCDGRSHGSSALNTLLGSPNTPDLRNKFVLGASATRPRGPSSEGQETVTLTHQQSGIPAHSHNTVDANASHSHPIDRNDFRHGHSGWTGTPDIGEHTHGSGGHTHSLWALQDVALGSPNARRITGGSQGGAGGSWDGAGGGDHSHSGGGHNHSIGISEAFITDNDDTSTKLANAVHGHTIQNNTATNASQAHNNMPPFYSMVYIIRL